MQLIHFPLVIDEGNHLSRYTTTSHNKIHVVSVTKELGGTLPVITAHSYLRERIEPVLQRAIEANMQGSETDFYTHHAHQLALLQRYAAQEKQG